MAVRIHLEAVLLLCRRLDGGKNINEYQIARYLQRYVTKGTKKSGLLIDLMKMIHYAIFEIVRRIKAGQLDFNEPSV